MFGTMIVRVVAPAALAVALIAGMPAQEAQAAGTIGRSGAAGGTCGLTGREIVVSAPFIEAVRVAAQPGTFTVGGGSIETGNMRQDVGFRVWLQRYNGSSWVYTDQTGEGAYDRTSLFTTTVVGQTNLGTSWWAYDFRRGIRAGDMTFAIRQSGHYRLITEVFWYPTSLVGGGSTVLASSDLVSYTGYFGTTHEWCYFG